jgi:hypothetical protein
MRSVFEMVMWQALIQKQWPAVLQEFNLAGLPVRQPALAAAGLAPRIRRGLRLRNGAVNNRADGKKRSNKGRETKHR